MALSHGTIERTAAANVANTDRADLIDIFIDTADERLKGRNSAGALLELDGTQISATEETIAAGAGGALLPGVRHSKLESDVGGDAGTLADGSIVGQEKEVTFVTDGGGDWVLTPANLSGGTTITFADVGDHVLLQWDGTNWVMLKSINLADGSSAPVLA